MDVMILLAAGAVAAIALPASVFAQAGDPGLTEEAVEVGVRYDAASLAFRLIPVFIIGAGLAGFLIWKQKHKKGIS